MKSLKLLLPALILLFANMVKAQESEIVKLRGEVRVDYAREYNRHSLKEGNSGFIYKRKVKQLLISKL